MIRHATFGTGRRHRCAWPAAAARAGLALWVAAALSVVAGGPASATPPPPQWMVTGTAINTVDAFLGNGALTTNSFDVPSTLELADGVGPAGWTAQSVVGFTAFGPGRGSFLTAVDHGLIPAGTTYVLYDDEHWDATPVAEQEDPGSYMAQFVALAHQQGYRAIVSPAVDLMAVAPCAAASEPRWYDYLHTCDVPDLAAEAGADVYEIQSQDLENSTSPDPGCTTGCYAAFVEGSVAEADAEAATLAEPAPTVLAGLSTNPNGVVSTAHALDADTRHTRSAVAGYWLNVPVTSTACPRCLASGAPWVASEYLSLLGYAGGAAPSLTAITATTPSPVVGQPVDVEVQVAGTATGRGVPAPGGSVTVSDGTRRCAAMLSGTEGTASGSCTLAEPAAGAATLRATYAGDADFAASASGPVPITVAPSPTATSLTASPAHPVAGEPVTLDAVVTGAYGGTAPAPTGTVAVTDGSQSCAAPLTGTGGTASGSCTITETAPGAYAFEASYPGDANFTGSSGTTTTVVGVPPTATAVTATPSSVADRARVSYGAVVTPLAGGGTPTGSVTFTAGATLLCTAVLSGGSGVCDASDAPVGHDTVTGTYGGDPSFGPSAGTAPLGVGLTTVALASSSDPAPVGTAVTYTATVSPAPTGGHVAFTSQSKGIAGCTKVTVQAATGTARCTVTYTVSRVYKIRAAYSGSSAFAPSSSTVLDEKVRS